MQAQTLRQSLVLSLLLTAAWAVITHVLSDEQSVLATLVSLPIFFAVIFLTMRATNRLMMMLAGRFGPKPRSRTAESNGRVEPSSERPEHARRRRQRRRRSPRGGRRRST